MDLAFLSLMSALAGAGVPPSIDVQAIPATGQEIAAELTPNDDQRRSGKFEDIYLVEGRAGQRLEIQLDASSFDTFLHLSGPGDFSLSNDDGRRGETNSRLVVSFPAAGQYRLGVTSFRPGVTGAYRLRLRPVGAEVAVSRSEPASAIEIGSALTGRLEASDERMASGEYLDRYRFRARRGQRVTASVRSGEFDTYLTLRRPDGSQDENDDSPAASTSSTDSRIDTVLAEDGEYILTVTSFRAGESGKYQLTLAPSPGLPRQTAVAGGPRVAALVIGVSDYGGRTGNLPRTDEDARELLAGLRNAGLLHPASRILVNNQASTSNVAAAFREIASSVGPDDMFLFFFSGHGDQLDTGRSAAELDGRAETIELHDAAMKDAELERLVSSVNGRLTLVAIDACFAGGFRNLINRPNVMGLFSSEEDLTSLVASQFKAGGFLSYFLRTGLSGEADDDGDRIVTAGELATYVRRRFRREGDIPAHTREEELNFQNLVIERGGVHVDDVVVRLAGETQAAASARPLAAGASARTDVKLRPAAFKSR